MAEQNCTQCGHSYDPDSTVVPSPIPDKMCSECGTVLTDEEIANLTPEIGGA